MVADCAGAGRPVVEVAVRAVVQRVLDAEVVIGATTVARIERPGLLVLLGVTHTDGPAEVVTLARKIWELRIMRGEHSARDLGAALLVVSQFTLYADTGKGRRPSWSAAAPAPVSGPVFDQFCAELEVLGAPVERGVFGADMAVRSINDGPVTILLEV